MTIDRSGRRWLNAYRQVILVRVAFEIRESGGTDTYGRDWETREEHIHGMLAAISSDHEEGNVLQ